MKIKKNRIICIVIEFLLFVSYFTIGLLTANYSSATSNLIYSIVFWSLQLLLSLVLYKYKFKILLLLNIILYFSIGVPYSFFITNLLFDGFLTNIVYCGVHDDNTLIFRLSAIILLVVDVVLLLLKLKRKSGTVNGTVSLD